jgi:hypothetical protein
METQSLDQTDRNGIFKNIQETQMTIDKKSNFDLVIGIRKKKSYWSYSGNETKQSFQIMDRVLVLSGLLILSVWFHIS